MAKVHPHRRYQLPRKINLHPSIIIIIHTENKRGKKSNHWKNPFDSHICIQNSTLTSRKHVVLGLKKRGRHVTPKLFGLILWEEG